MLTMKVGPQAIKASIVIPLRWLPAIRIEVKIRAHQHHLYGWLLLIPDDDNYKVPQTSRKMYVQQQKEKHLIKLYLQFKIT